MNDKYITLTKLSDDAFNGSHPNGIYVGNSSIQGYPRKGINIGEQLFLHPSLKIDSSPNAWTSTVESFDKKKMILKTRNSTYKIDIRKDE